jgi:hypothetical protein
MSTRKVKKVAVDTNDISGLKSSRYEKMQVSYGAIEASSYDLLDTLMFADVPSRDIIRATIVAHTSSPITLEIYPGTDISGPVTLAGVTSPVKISYVIEYVRGSGRVGPDAYQANEYGSGAAMESGEGALLQIVVGDISSLTTTQVRALSTKQVSTLSTSQIEALTTAQVAAMETTDIAALTTKQLRAMQTVDVAALTSAELAVLSTTQLHAFSTAQTAVLTTAQKAGLSAGQLAALQ